MVISCLVLDWKEDVVLRQIQHRKRHTDGKDKENTTQIIKS